MGFINSVGSYSTVSSPDGICKGSSLRNKMSASFSVSLPSNINMYIIFLEGVRHFEIKTLIPSLKGDCAD